MIILTSIELFYDILMEVEIYLAEVETMSDTLYYSGKLKRNVYPSELYEKINKSIKKKGPTKLWECHLSESEDSIIIDFNDEVSETFCFEFNKVNEFHEFCKVGFPLEGELFEDGKSEFKALLDILYKCKNMFSKFEIHDDYGLASAYWECKRIKIQLRELTDEEINRLMRLYSDGNNTHESLLWAVMAEDMEMTVDEFKNYINYHAGIYEDFGPKIYRPLQNYLYETTEYKKEGRLCEISENVYYDLSRVSFAIFAFIEGLSWIFFDGNGYGKEISLEKKRPFSPKDAQVGMLFRERFAPLYLEEDDNFERCVLVYRYFVSVYEFLGFRFVGRDKNACKTYVEKILEEYGEEKGKIFLTFRCTCLKYLKSGKNSPKYDKYSKNIDEYMKNNWTKEFLHEYLEFKKKYNSRKLMSELEYRAFNETEYIDESIVK